MKLYVDSIDANQCRDLSNHPSKTPERKQYPKGNPCRVDLVLRSLKDNSQTYLELKRVSPKKDIFEGSGGKHANSKELKALESRGWKMPHGSIKKAIYIQNRFFEDETHSLIQSNDLLEKLRSDMITFIAFGNIEQSDPQKFNANLNTRLVERIHQALYQFPEKWFPVRNFIRGLLKDSNLSVEEKDRLQWLNDVAGSINYLYNTHRDKYLKIPGFDQALKEALLFQYSPEYRVSDFPKSPTLQQSAKTYWKEAEKKEDGTPRAEFFWHLNLAFRDLSSNDSIKNNLVLLGSNHQLEKLTKQAWKENWGDLLAKPSPEEALRSGLQVQYAQSETQKEIIELFSKNVTVVFEGEEQKPHFSIAIESFNKEVMKYIEDPELDPKKRKEGIGFIDQVILGQLLAQGQKMRIFWEGYFQEQVNFYPQVKATQGLSHLQELTQWTLRKTKAAKSKVQGKNKFNRAFLSGEIGLMGVGLPLSLIFMKIKPIRNPFMVMLGTGLGGMSGNLLCNSLGISNSWRYCDILGGLVGGTLSGWLSAYVLPGDDDLFLLPPVSKNPPPGPDHRFPTDLFGP